MNEHNHKGPTDKSAPVRKVSFIFHPLKFFAEWNFEFFIFWKRSNRKYRKEKLHKLILSFGFNTFENFKIFKKSTSWNRLLWHRITFFVSQRTDVILSENKIQTPADRMIWTEFLITSVSISKIELKLRNRPDCRGRIRGAIAPVDEITLRV